MLLHTTHILTDWVDTSCCAALMLHAARHEGRRLVDVDENALYWRYVWLLWMPIYDDLLGAAAVKTERIRDASCPGAAWRWAPPAPAHQIGSDFNFRTAASEARGS